MKKLISVLLSIVIMLTAVVGINFTAYADPLENTIVKEYTLGSSINGFLSENGVANFLKVNVPQSGKINFVVEGSHYYSVTIYSEKSLDSSICYFDCDYRSDLGKAYSEKNIYLVAGIYYFKVGGQKNINYTIKTSFTPANESFTESLDVNNNTFENANSISVDKTYKGMVGENDKMDFYLFTVPAGTYELNIKSIDTIKYSVYSMNHECVSSDFIFRDSSTGIAELSKNVTLKRGSYYLKVEKYSSDFYTFSINSPHQHNYKYSYSVASTYTSKGYDVYTCSCGELYKTNYKPVKKLDKVKLKSVTSSKRDHTIKASWDKKSGASGYQIYYSSNKSFKKISAKKIIKSGKATAYVGKNFTKGKTYYAKVRAYKNVNGQKAYGKWSNVKSVKCK